MAPFTVAVASPKAGTGKTTSAVFLAEALSARGSDVLLVDADRGDSALRWSDLAGGLGWPVVAMQVSQLHRKLPDVVGGRDAVVIDVPQLEDHKSIAKGALRSADLWLIPVAPAGVEVDRMLAPEVVDLLAEVQSDRDADGLAPAVVVAVLTRTNRARPTSTGPDADVRTVLADLGWTVARSQIPHGDERYRQPFGCVIESDEHYDALLSELLQMKEDA